MVTVSQDNVELSQEIAAHKVADEEANLKVYADGRISKRMLKTVIGHTSMELANVFATAYDESKQHFANSPDYIYNPDNA